MKVLRSAIKVGLGLASIGLIATAPDLAYAQAAGVAADLAGGIESVTVTARRREESAQDVPIPIATLSGAALESNGDFRLEDLNRNLPSTHVFFGNPRQTSIAVRGLGNNPANDALEASVGVYLDNVYLGRPGMANLDLIDVEQIDLLRGPQGTLFGKNTTAGVLNVSTRKPTFEPEAQLESSVGNRDFYQVRGAVSGGLTETLAGRFSFAHSSKDGFVRNLTTGKNLNGFERTGFRGQLLYRPSDELSVRVIGDYNEEHSDASVNTLYSLGPNDGALVKTRFAQLGVPLYLDPDHRTTFNNHPAKMDVRQGGGSVEANYQFGGGHTLTSITAYRSWWFQPTNDGDFTPLSALSGGIYVDDEQWSQEIRLASPTGGPIDYVAGLYYFNQRQDNAQRTEYGPDAGLFLGRPILANAVSQIDQKLTTDSYAVFGQATWHASERLDFTFGARQTREDKSTWVRRNLPVGGAPGIEAALGYYESGTLKRSDDTTSLLLSGSLKVTADLLLYSSVSQGAKSGGINPDLPKPGLTVRSLYIEPEEATDFELGFKSTLFDRLQLNANLFWTNVTDYQATTLELSPVTNTQQQVLSNVGKVRSRGVETEISTAPLAGVTLALNASYNDVEYRDYRNAPCAAERSVQGATVCDLTGQQVVGAPKWVINPSAGYEHRIGRFDLLANLNYAWRSSVFATADNSQFSRVDGYGVLNARVGVASGLSSGQWQLSLWGRNLLDKSYVVGGLSGASQFLTYSLYPGEPRSYGASLRIDF
ncbi:MAG TPA: TonB-dependent receptor [Steroidobacter sp.]|uniref:TonB-dependent receptor n=1 Tax=Steroidobacter sp. TaxID=1978227 RepID=UPI002ED9C131